MLGLVTGQQYGGGTRQQGGRGRVHHVHSYARRRPLCQPGRHLASQDDFTPMATIRSSSQGPRTVKKYETLAARRPSVDLVASGVHGHCWFAPTGSVPSTDVASLALALINIQLHNSHIRHPIRQMTMLLHFQLGIWEPKSLAGSALSPKTCLRDVSPRVHVPRATRGAEDIKSSVAFSASKVTPSKLITTPSSCQPLSEIFKLLPRHCIFIDGLPERKGQIEISLHERRDNDTGRDGARGEVFDGRPASHDCGARDAGGRGV